MSWASLATVVLAHATGIALLSGPGTPSLGVAPASEPAVMVEFIASAPPSPSVTPSPAPVPAPRTPAPAVAEKSPKAEPAPTSRAPVRAPTPEPPAPIPAAPSSAAPAAAPPLPSPPVAAPSQGETPAAAAPLAAAAPRSPTQGEGLPTISARADAAYLNNPAPAYPRLSRRRGEEGQVVLRVHVLSNGRTDKVEIAESSNHPRLDEAAREAVRNWRFVPARRGEEAVDSWLRVPIVFRLEE